MMSDMSEKILKYTGNPSQVFYAQRMKLMEGRADGEDVIEVFNGRLLFWVMPGRCMDIGRMFFDGTNLSFLSKAGYTNAAYYDAAGMGGLDTFSPGFLTTCGLRNSGLPNECEGEMFGFHGRIGQTPAEEICVERILDTDKPYILLKGRTREGRLFGSSLELKREISVEYGSPEITIQDTITNYGPVDEPVFLLYHYNMGYPLLDENTEFVTTHEYEKPVDDNAATDEANRSTFRKPEARVPERCYYYRQKASGADAFGACINRKRGLGVAIHTNPDELPLFCQWKSWAAGDYVMGMEPCNCYGDGRAEHIRRGQTEVIPAYGSRTKTCRIEMLDQSAIQMLCGKTWI